MMVVMVVMVVVVIWSRAAFVTIVWQPVITSITTSPFTHTDALMTSYLIG